MSGVTKWFADRRVGVKLGALAGIFAVSLAALAFAATGAIRSLGHDADAMQSRGVDPLMTIYALNGDLDGLRIRVLRHAVARDVKAKADIEQQITKKEQLIDADLVAYRKQFPNGLDAKRAARLGT